MTSLLILKSMLFANALQKKKNKSNKSISKKMMKAAPVMCRICDGERGHVPIFNNALHPNIPEEIKHFSGVTVNESENYSKMMCRNCLELLNGCIMFRELCQRNNQKLTGVAVKKENNSYERDKPLNGDGENSLNVPSPASSEDNFDVWGTCDLVFNSLDTYNSHLSECSKSTRVISKPSTGEVTKRKFLCDVCGKTACSNASLLVHMATHENIFPFKCDVCPYQGRTMDLLKVHKRSHLADKPFKCTQCPKATTTASNLAKHMRHVHSTTRPFKCTYCEKAFSYQHDMKRHIKDIHLRQGTVECDLCDKKFNTKKILQGHRLKIHKIKGERQGRLPSYLQCQIGEQNENNLNYYHPSF